MATLNYNDVLSGKISQADWQMHPNYISPSRAYQLSDPIRQWYAKYGYDFDNGGAEQFTQMMNEVTAAARARIRPQDTFWNDFYAQLGQQNVGRGPRPQGFDIQNGQFIPFYANGVSGNTRPGDPNFNGGYNPALTPPTIPGHSAQPGFNRPAYTPPVQPSMPPVTRMRDTLPMPQGTNWNQRIADLKARNAAWYAQADQSPYGNAPQRPITTPGFPE